MNCFKKKTTGFVSDFDRLIPIGLRVLTVWLLLLAALSGAPVQAARVESISLLEDERSIFLNLRSDGKISNFKTNLMSGNVYVIDIAGLVIPESEIKYVRKEPLEFIKVWQYDAARRVARMMLKLTRQARVDLKVNDLGDELKISVSKELVSTIYTSYPASSSDNGDSMMSGASGKGGRDTSMSGSENRSSDSGEFETAARPSLFDPVHTLGGQVSPVTRVNIDVPAARGTTMYNAGFTGGMAEGAGGTSSSVDSGKGQKKITFKFVEYEIAHILEFLSDVLDATILIDKSVSDGVRKKKISLYIKNLGIRDALNLVLETNGLAYKKFDEMTYIVMTQDEFETEKKRIEKVYRLVNAKPQDLLKIITASKALADKLSIENITFDDRTNSIVAYETPARIALLDKIIPKLDQKEKQVQIDMKLVEISKKAGKHLGIIFDDAFTITNVADFPSRVPVSATLSALLNSNKAKVLASPRIRAVHNKQASITIGETIPVPYFDLLNSTSGSNTNNSNGNNNNRSTGIIGGMLGSSTSGAGAGSTNLESYGYAAVKKFKDVPVGIILNVSPFVHNDSEVTLDLNIEVSSVVDITPEGQVHKETRNTKSIVRIDDGETAVLGGIIRDSERNRKVKVPFLGDIPGLGRLFQHHINDVESTEMIMFITPHLVNLDEDDIHDRGLRTDMASELFGKDSTGRF